MEFCYGKFHHHSHWTRLGGTSSFEWTYRSTEGVPSHLCTANGGRNTRCWKDYSCFYWIYDVEWRSPMTFPFANGEYGGLRIWRTDCAVKYTPFELLVFLEILIVVTVHTVFQILNSRLIQISKVGLVCAMGLVVRQDDWRSNIEQTHQTNDLGILVSMEDLMHCLELMEINNCAACISPSSRMESRYIHVERGCYHGRTDSFHFPFRRKWGYVKVSSICPCQRHLCLVHGLFGNSLGCCVYSRTWLIDSDCMIRWNSYLSRIL